MRNFINIVETAIRNSPLLESSPNDPKLRAFLLAKWKERAKELGLPEPHDLSGACKGTALFAQKLFGGDIHANPYHTWVNKDGTVIDLADDSEDAKALDRGEIPPSGREYYRMTNAPLPDYAHEEDEYFMEEEDFIDDMRSWEWRVGRWLEEWKNINGN